MNEDKLKNWFRWEIWIIGVAIVSLLWFTTQLESIRTKQAVMDNKLDTLLAWTAKHDDETVAVNRELNETFAYIYERLGEKFSNNLQQY